MGSNGVEVKNKNETAVSVSPVQRSLTAQHVRARTLSVSFDDTCAKLNTANDGNYSSTEI